MTTSPRMRRLVARLALLALAAGAFLTTGCCGWHSGMDACYPPDPPPAADPCFKPRPEFIRPCGCCPR